uniref:lethal(3)malignant brain tumor-like protein 3 isoform X1 n=1 Tax=Styela clava TaxID=7725 RepID=UPI001939718A|nr:lethal(3)malignant brain tumor-like protein 3 isoform X1 [Styela clava]
MDMKFNPPNLESFFSPNHQPHSLSTIWADKSKQEEEVDPGISDMEEQDQAKDDAENSKENDSTENLNDALEWENGVGKLPGSDLKFRVNELGDIEVITESVQMDEVSNIMDEAEAVENGVIPSDRTPAPDSDTENQLSIVEESDRTDEVINDNGDSNIFVEQNGSSSDNIVEQNTEKDSKSAISSETDLNLENKNCEDKDEDTQNESNIQPKDENADVAVRSESSLEDNLTDFDPVLHEDIASMLYDDANTNINLQKTDDDCLITPTPSPGSTYKDEDYSPEHSDLKIVSVRSDSAETGKCLICGNTTRPGKRFCSRQCVGRNATKRRRENQMFVSKKYLKNKRRAKNLHNKRDQRSLHTDDILTVVQDDSPGRKNDLKIKIRWSSASNENQEEYNQNDKDIPKRKAVLNGNYDGTRGTNRKKFIWSTYLEEEQAVPAPLDAFEDFSGKNPYLTRNPFQVGMAMEGVDPEHESLICPLFVAELRGCRIRLSFCGYSESYDFWRNCDSPFIFPCGFCEETNRILQPPKECKIENFVWNEYAKSHQIYPAPKECFVKISDIETKSKDITFKIGQKLEAVDKHNPDLICVATVQDVINEQVLIHFDGWSNKFDFWCPISSQLIHSTGWCEKNNKVLLLPEDYDTTQKFDWSIFLTQTQTTAVDEKLFSTGVANKFKQGMKLEAVDQRNQRLIRVASIAEIDNIRVKIHFDGWSDMYDFYTDLESSDLHPIGWCAKSGHPIEPPVSLSDMEDSAWQTSGCPIPGCAGLGHIKGAKYMTHYSEFGCPYSPQNLTKEVLKDRLAVHKPRRSAHMITDENNSINNDGDPDYIEEQVITHKTGKVLTRKRLSNSDQNHLTSPSKKKLKENSEDSFQHERSRGNTAQVVSKWTIEDVARFIRNLTSQQIYEQIFMREEIDGEAMLMLTQSDMLRILKIKLGPAVKIYNAIMTIKEAA